MKERAKCEHNVLVFHSGDYYVQCKDCRALWVSIAEGAPEIQDSGNHNQGVGASLSGAARVSDAAYNELARLYHDIFIHKDTLNNVVLAQKEFFKEIRDRINKFYETYR